MFYRIVDVTQTHRANSSSPGGMFKSRQRIVWLALRPELIAMTPAISSSFIVRSRCKSDVDSGKNSARAIAPADVIEVEERNKRLSAVFKVNAVRNDCI
jgi:hypothetical protein